jgi:hypothetical protein
MLLAIVIFGTILIMMGGIIIALSATQYWILFPFGISISIMGAVLFIHIIQRLRQ